MLYFCFITYEISGIAYLKALWESSLERADCYDIHPFSSFQINSNT